LGNGAKHGSASWYFAAPRPRCRRKVGRDSLVPSHAGTRLPIAVTPGPGRSPSARRRLRRKSVLPSKRKNRGCLPGSPCKKSMFRDFLRRHYPHQV